MSFHSSLFAPSCSLSVSFCRNLEEFSSKKFDSFKNISLPPCRRAVVVSYTKKRHYTTSLFTSLKLTAQELNIHDDVPSFYESIILTTRSHRMRQLT